MESNSCRSNVIVQNTCHLLKTCRCGKKNHWLNCCNVRLIRKDQTTDDYVIEAAMKGEVQNEMKKIRNKEEQAKEKMKNKQQLDNDGSMEKNKEKLYYDRPAINKKQ